MTVSDYTCHKCNQSFKSKWHLTRHLNKKKPCIDINTSIRYKESKSIKEDKKYKNKKSNKEPSKPRKKKKRKK